MAIFLLEDLVKIALYCIMFYSLWILVGPMLRSSLDSSYRHWKRTRHIKRLSELNQTEIQKKRDFFVFRHLEILLTSLKKESSTSNVYNFLFLSLLIFVITAIFMTISLKDFVFAFVIAISFALLPYITLRFRLANKRLKSSFAFLKEFHIILQNYQSTGRDIYYTVLNVVKDLEDKDLKNVFMKLLSSLQKDRNESDLKESVKIFVYTINSTFAKRFGKLLLKAHLNNANISMALMDMNTDIKKRKQDMENQKTNYLDTVILGYSPIALFPLMIFLAYRISGVVNFGYLFMQHLPLMIFSLAIIVSLISVFSAFLLSKPRADL